MKKWKRKPSECIEILEESACLNELSRPKGHPVILANLIKM